MKYIKKNKKVVIGFITILVVVLVVVQAYGKNTTQGVSLVSNELKAKINEDIPVDIELVDTITLSEGGSYTITGIITDGQIVVTSGEEDVTLVLNGVDIANSSGAAIYIQEAGDVNIKLAEGSTNVLTQSGLDVDEEEKAALYSTSDLVISGNSDAVLVVESVVADGISGNDDLDIKNATVFANALDDGIRGKDSVTLDGATVTIVAEDDGLKSSNEEDSDRGWVYVTDTNLVITAGDDGIKAETSVTIDSGTINILESNEGIEGFDVSLNGGVITINATDDGLNVTDGASASGSNGVTADRTAGPPVDEVIEGVLTLGGATVFISSDSDGLDSNGSTVMTGGLVVVNGPTTDREGAIDTNGTFTISGGTLVAVGSSGMAESPDETSIQNSIIANLDTIQSAGTRITIIDDNTGAAIMSFVSEKSFQSVVYSSDKLITGNSYSIYTGGSVLGDEDFGLTTNTNLDGGTFVAKLTISGALTKYGNISTPGIGGGGRRDVMMQGDDSISIPSEGSDINGERPELPMMGGGGLPPGGTPPVR